MISSSPRADGRTCFAISHDLIVVEVEAGHGVVRARVLGLLLDGERTTVGVELDDTVALRGRSPGSRRPPRRLLQLGRALSQERAEAVTVEDVVAQDQADRVAADEVAPMRNACARPSGLGCSA